MSHPANIGRYEIRSELGRGMMGVVYLAHDTALGRDIALKTFQIAMSVDPEERESFERRFLTEARVAAGLSHPGIVVVHDVGRDPETGTLFMALEKLEGQTLDGMIKERAPLPWREALALVERVAVALHHAHSKGVIHRDVKPANIMILPSREPKVMDFGIAKIETSQLTAAGQFFGTPLYMSPEQARSGRLDARSDQFSLGAVLYELLTGKKAFAGENLTQIIVRVMGYDPPPLWMPDVPESLTYVLARCLAKEPTERYADCKALAEDLADIQASRVPRHRSGWAAPPLASGTVVSAAPLQPGSGTGAGSAIDDLDAALAGLVSPAAAPPAAIGRRQAAPPTQMPLPPSGRTPTAPSVRTPFPWPPRPGMLPYVVAAALVLVAGVGIGALLLASRGSGAPAPTSSTPSEKTVRRLPPVTEAPVAEADVPALPPVTEAPVVEADVPATAPPRASSAPRPARPAPGAARLAISFEHSLKQGSLQVFIDDELALEEELGSRVTKKILALKFRKGTRSDTLELPAGKHEVRVRVSWDDNVKTASIWADFEEGSERRLKAKLGGFAGIRKSLSLDWQ